MSKEKLGQEPAFPFTRKEMRQFGEYTKNDCGISKRFYAACAAMQGILAGLYSDDTKNSLKHIGNLAEQEKIEITSYIIGMCYEFADELLKHENSKKDMEG